MARIGESPPRPDGQAKVSGEARYTDDIVLPGMLFGATVRSPHPRARIVAIRWHPGRAPAGAFCVTSDDVPGPNGIQLLDDSWPVLARDEVLHVGEPVALVAAGSRLDARRAAEAVEVVYEPLDPVLSWEEAEREEPLYRLAMDHGELDRGLAEADLVVEETYFTGYQEHIYIETQGMIAEYGPDGGLSVIGSMQCPFYVHKALMHAMDLPATKVRVRPAAVGGGFGGKEDYPSMIAAHAALLARASQRPVKIVYDRHEDIIGTTKRHPGRIRHRTGITRDGRLTAMDIQVDLDGGAYLSLSPVVLSRAVLHASGAYRCPHVRVGGRVLRTNTPPNAAFRGFGAPQVLFAVERQMDLLARALGLDPLTIRERNVLDPGDSLPTGQVLKADASARLCLDEAAKRTNFRERWRENEAARAARPDGETRRGIGISLYFHGAGFTGRGEHQMRSPVTVRLRPEGRIEVLTAMTDMGQGAMTVLPLIAADAAGVNLDDVFFAPADTGEVPDSGPTVASRTTMVVGGTIALAVAGIRDRVLEWAKGALNGGGELTVDGGAVAGAGGSLGPFREVARMCFEAAGNLEYTVHHEPPEWQRFDEKTYQGTAYATYGWGADVVEVDMDPDTDEVRPTTATVVCEVGKVVHPVLCRGQIEGGTLQAVAWGYMEEIKVRDGRYLNDRLATYIIPTIKDAPRMDVVLLERPWEGGPSGAKGVGELPMDGGAPAVAQAIENATGVIPDAIPATPERIHEWRAAGRTVSPARGDALGRPAGAAGKASTAGETTS